MLQPNVILSKYNIIAGYFALVMRWRSVSQISGYASLVFTLFSCIMTIKFMCRNYAKFGDIVLPKCRRQSEENSHGLCSHSARHLPITLQIYPILSIIKLIISLFVK